MITTILALSVLALFLFYLFKIKGRPPNYPPGPSWWPFIGNGFLLRKLSIQLNGQHLALLKLGKDFNTSILGLKLGRELVVVGLSNDAVRAILTRDVFTGRPISFFMILRCFGKRRGITSTDGESWRVQRAFTVRHLKQLGYGKKTMEYLIMDEAEELVQYLKKGGEMVYETELKATDITKNKLITLHNILRRLIFVLEKEVKNIGEIIALSVLNVLWALATGKRLEKNDTKLKRLLELLQNRSRAFDMAGGTLNQMPWLRFVAPKKSGFSLLHELNSALKNFLTETIEDKKASYNPNKTRNIIDAFLHEQNSRKYDSDFSDEQLVVLLLDLFLGGAQTTSQTLDFAFLLMIKNPDIQEKVYNIIMEKIGKDRLPTLEDKPELAYIDAALLEVMRIFCVVPIIGPRRSLEDTTLNGYFIPKDTTILLNLYAVHHDETLFPDPLQFRPERFLDTKGKLVNENSVLTFGLGKRRCLGENLAKSFLFLIFTRIIQNFEIMKPSEDSELSLEPLLGLTLAPKPYSAQFRPR